MVSIVSVWSAIGSQLSSLSLLILLPIPVLYAVWNWFTRNQVERLFLSKNLAIINRFIEATFMYFLFTTGALLSIGNFPTPIDSLLNNTAFPFTLYVLYVLLYVLFLFESTPKFDEIKNKEFFNTRFFIGAARFIKNKFTVSICLFFIILLAVLLYRHFINLSLLGYQSLVKEHSTQGEVNSTKDILSFIIGDGFKEYSYLIYSVLLIFSLFFYAIVAFPLRFITHRLLVEERQKRQLKATVILKDGRKFVNVYLQNNTSQNFFHLHNKANLPTQHLVLHKDEVERFLFNEHNHKTEDDIKQE